MKPSEKGIYDYLAEYEAAAPEKKFLISAEQQVTVREAVNTVSCIAVRLTDAGICKGDLIALRTVTSIDAVLLFLALEIIGAVAVLTDPHETVLDFLQKLEGEIPVKAALTDEAGDGGWTLIKGAAGERCPISTRLNNCELSRSHCLEISGDSSLPAVIIFTSGSTGKTKAVTLSQYNCVNNLEDSRFIGGYREDDIALGFLPLNHVFGLALLLGALVLQHTFVFSDSARPDDILKCIEKYHVTRMNGIPTLFQAMAEKCGAYDIHSLRVGFVGGSPWTAQQFIQIEESLDMTLIPVYGMSECIGISCASWKDDRKVRMNGVGPFYSMNDGWIQKEDGTCAKEGEEGEILVKGPARMLGYYGEDAGSVFDEEGYLHTGDLGFLDESGILHITGRKKDIIIRNGINISSRKIEEILLEQPEIQQAAVTGIPNEHYGEVPCAMVVCNDKQMSEYMLSERLKQSGRLTKAEFPYKILLVSELPLTATHKPDKVKIYEWFIRNLLL